MKNFKIFHVSGFLFVFISVFIIISPNVQSINFSYTNKINKNDVKSAVKTWVQYKSADVRIDAVVEKIDPYIVNDEIIAYIAHLKGGSFCICGADKIMLPVYLYCPSGIYDQFDSEIQYFLSEMEKMYNYYHKDIKEQNNLIYENENIFNERAQYWNDLIAGVVSKNNNTDNEKYSNIREFNLKALWNQQNPYCNFCPPGGVNDDYHCAVGCVGLSIAQVMKFWNWPLSGIGKIDYYSTSKNYHVVANFDDEYDWKHMAYYYEWSDYFQGWLDEKGNLLDKDVHIPAVAELCFEASASIYTDFITDETSTGYLLRAPSAFTSFFRYSDDCFYESPASINRMISEIQWFRPILFKADTDKGYSSRHAWVIHGYDTSPPGATMFLMTIGGDHDKWPPIWWTLDEVLINDKLFIKNKAHLTWLAPDNAVFARTFDILNGDDWIEIFENKRDGSPSDPFLFLREAIDNTPSKGTLVFKSDSIMSVHPDELLIKKSITIKSLDAKIKTGGPEVNNRLVNFNLPLLKVLQKNPVLYQLTKKQI